MEDSVENLIVAANEGDEKAMLRVLERFKPLVRHHAGAFCCFFDDWESAEMTAVTALLEGVRTYAPQCGFVPAYWLKCAVYNSLRAAARKAQRERRLLLRTVVTADGMTDVPPEIADETAPLPETALLEKELRCRLRRAVASLSEKERTLVHLRYTCRLSEKRIGAVIGRSQSGVSRDLAAVVRRLRETLET